MLRTEEKKSSENSEASSKMQDFRDFFRKYREWVMDMTDLYNDICKQDFFCNYKRLSGNEQTND